MKKKIWIILAIVLLIVIAFAVCRYCIYEGYELPFRAEDVRSVTLSKLWEYRIIEDGYEIEHLIQEFNRMRVVPNDIDSEDQIATGAIGYSVYFELHDGSQLAYSAIPMQSGGIYFTDADHNTYTARHFAPAIVWNQLDETDYPPIPSNYYGIYYQGQVYEGTATVMRVPDDAQLVGTITGITYYPDSELECFKGKTGRNVYVWNDNGMALIGIEIEQDVWPYTQAFAIEMGYVGRPMINAQLNKWGLALEAENVTPSGLTLLCHQSGGENIFELSTGSYYVIQRKENGEWADVEYLPQEYDVAWTAEAWMIQKGSTTTWDVNWEWLYGELPPGEYRIGKDITNFRATGDYDSEILCAEFIVK